MMRATSCIRRALVAPKGRALRLAAVTLTLASCGAPTTDLQFDEPLVISAATGVGAAPMFAVAPDGREAIAWVSAEGGGTDGRLHVRVSDDGGASASSAGNQHSTVLSDPLGPIEPHGEAPPKLAWSADGSLHALYVVGKVVPGRRFPVSALRHVRSSDGGATWSAPHTVTDDTLVFGSHNFHALHAAAGGRVIAAWLDGREGQSAAFLARSTDGGLTWGANQRISMGEACPCCRTAIATASGGHVWVAWRAVLPGSIRDIVVAHSADGGATFGPAERVHADDWVFEACPHAGPSLITDSTGRPHIAWWTGREGRSGVWYARADEQGRFGTPVALSEMGAMRPVHVQLAVEGDIVAAAWDDAMTPVPRVMVRVSHDGGASFGAPAVLSAAGEAALFPVIGLVNGRLTVAWTQKAAEAHHHDGSTRPDMSKATAVMGLPEVGQAAVIVRRTDLQSSPK
ncbi:MAG TPA: sialidase family protein [Gemmatimonadaceae bacterium]|nr:sialidase family protein [Gemmatimonadaceae bacterium]